MSTVANATKPKKNYTGNIDVNKKMMAAEVTAVITKNDDYELNFVAVPETNTEYYYSVRVQNVLSVLSESEMMLNLCKSFDQFKIMKVHLCIDCNKLPMKTYFVSKVDNNWEFYDTVNNVTRTWDEMYEIYGEEVINKTAYPKEIEYTEDSMNAMFLGVEQPVVLIAASRRGIPKGMLNPEEGFEPYTYQNGIFVGPNFDTIMSYGSAIWQSKLPGASIHLSLEVSATSNSERMMTMPCELMYKLNNLCSGNQVSTVMQQGRFIPTIYLAAKVPQININIALNNLNLNIEQYRGDNPDLQVSSSNVTFTKEGVSTPYIVRKTPSITEITDTGVVSNMVCSVMMYNTIRLKHLRLLTPKISRNYVRQISKVSYKVMNGVMQPNVTDINPKFISDNEKTAYINGGGEVKNLTSSVSVPLYDTYGVRRYGSNAAAKFVIKNRNDKNVDVTNIMDMSLVERMLPSPLIVIRPYIPYDRDPDAYGGLLLTNYEYTNNNNYQHLYGIGVGYIKMLSNGLNEVGLILTDANNNGVKVNGDVECNVIDLKPYLAFGETIGDEVADAEKVWLYLYQDQDSLNGNIRFTNIMYSLTNDLFADRGDFVIKSSNAETFLVDGLGENAPDVKFWKVYAIVDLGYKDQRVYFDN